MHKLDCLLHTFDYLNTFQYTVVELKKKSSLNKIGYLGVTTYCRELNYRYISVRMTAHNVNYFQRSKYTSEVHGW